MTGNELKRWRVDHGYTQDALSKELDVSRQTIANWEASDAIPTLLRLALETLHDKGPKVIGKRSTVLEYREIRNVEKSR